MDSQLAAGAFGALSQETRVKLLRLLSTTGASGMRPGELQSTLGIPSSTLSFHLAALEQAGLVQSTRQGRQIIYAVRIVGLRSLLAFITETCCADRPDLRGDIARLLPEDVTEEPTTLVPAFNVLFLCTHNSARSLLAEAILTRIGRGRFHAYSAGSQPVERPMPEVLLLLERLGHDVSRLRSKSWDQFVGPDAPRMDFVITLCDTAGGQQCPELGDRPVTAAWPLPDPKKFVGSETERTALLHELYTSMRRRLEAFVGLPLASLDRAAIKHRLDDMALGTFVS